MFTSIVCFECGITFGLVDDHVVHLKNSRGTFHCPNGHAQWFPGKTVRKELEEAHIQRMQLEHELERAQARLARLTSKRRKTAKGKRT